MNHKRHSPAPQHDHDKVVDTVAQVTKLEMAKRLIEEVKETLDLSSANCPGCGLVRYQNFNNKQSADQLEGAIGRIERTIGYLTAPPKAGEGDRR